MTTEKQVKQTVIDSFTVKEIISGVVDYKFFPSPQTCLAWLRDTGCEGILTQAATRYDDSWKGLEGQSIANLLETGHPEAAMRAFNSAKAKLAQNFAPGGRLKPAIAGGQWIVPEFLASNPLCARIKPRQKLPHKDFRFTLQVSAITHQSELSEVCATIARACWDYVLQGGTVSLTVSYIYGYLRESARGTIATVLEISVPFTSDSALALALSSAFLRPVNTMVASLIMSPVDGDTIPMRFGLKLRGASLLRGERRVDYPILSNLGIAP